MGKIDGSTPEEIFYNWKVYHGCLKKMVIY